MQRLSPQKFIAHLLSYALIFSTNVGCVEADGQSSRLLSKRSNLAGPFADIRKVSLSVLLKNDIWNSPRLAPLRNCIRETTEEPFTDFRVVSSCKQLEGEFWSLRKSLRLSYTQAAIAVKRGELLSDTLCDLRWWKKSKNHQYLDALGKAKLKLAQSVCRMNFDENALNQKLAVCQLKMALGRNANEHIVLTTTLKELYEERFSIPSASYFINGNSQERGSAWYPTTIAALHLDNSPATTINSAFCKWLANKERARRDEGLIAESLTILNSAKASERLDDYLDARERHEKLYEDYFKAIVHAQQELANLESLCTQRILPDDRSI